MGKIRQMGMREIRVIEQQIGELTRQRDALIADLGVETPKGGGSRRKARRHHLSGNRVDWDRVFAKLPKTSFQATVVKRIVPHVSSGTVSIRLARWVKEKKLRRTGTRRGTRYTRP